MLVVAVIVVALGCYCCCLLVVAVVVATASVFLAKDATFTALDAACTDTVLLRLID